MDDDDEIKVALIGRPNVGKSSIFNALVGQNVPLSAMLPALPVMQSIPGST